MDTLHIESMSTDEKIELAERLWQSIDKERTEKLSPAQMQLLENRLQMHSQNKEVGKSWQAIKQKYIH